MFVTWVLSRLSQAGPKAWKLEWQMDRKLQMCTQAESLLATVCSLRGLRKNMSKPNRHLVWACILNNYRSLYCPFNPPNQGLKKQIRASKSAVFSFFFFLKKRVTIAVNSGGAEDISSFSLHKCHVCGYDITRTTIVIGFLFAFMNAELLPVTQLQIVGAAWAVSFQAWLAVWCEAARRRVLTQRADFINAASVTKPPAVGQLLDYVQKLAPTSALLY